MHISVVSGPQIRKGGDSRCSRPSWGIPFLRGRGRPNHTLEQQVPANHCSRFSTQSRGQEKQAPAGAGGGGVAEVKHSLWF